MIENGLPRGCISPISHSLTRQGQASLAFRQTDKQGRGIGTYFLKKIEKAIKEIGMANIFLQTENNVPAYGFYQKNGFCELKRHVSFAKEI